MHTDRMILIVAPLFEKKLFSGIFKLREYDFVCPLLYRLMGEYHTFEFSYFKLFNI
jgi:hypothetical protein